MTATNRPNNMERGAKSLSSKPGAPPLPYDQDTLELYIDAKMAMLRHDQHHASCVAKRNWEDEGGRLQSVGFHEPDLFDDHDCVAVTASASARHLRENDK